MMHLFHDSTLNTWRLITEKLPEKPSTGYWNYDNAIKEYNAAIAALKQNALTVGNPPIIDAYLLANKIGVWVKDELYFWPGGYRINTFYGMNGAPDMKDAILTLPEEKKNTMENLTKEQAAFDYNGWSRDALIYHIMTLENKLTSGSVAAPKEHAYTDKQIIGLAEQELNSVREELKKRDKEIERLKFELDFAKGLLAQYADNEEPD